MDTDTELMRRHGPDDVTVQINLRVPYHYRETLTALAAKRHLSLNRLIINALVASYPPKQ